MLLADYWVCRTEHAVNSPHIAKFLISQKICDFGGLFIVIGNYLSKVRSNWFVGIRTPWTMSSEAVWNKTHRVGGKLFMLVGLIFILEPFMPLSWRAPIFIISMVVLLAETIGYSYWVYKKEKK